MGFQDDISARSCDSKVHLENLLGHLPKQNHSSTTIPDWKLPTEDGALKYEALDVLQREIRLLCIEADHDGQVQCNLKRHNLDTAPSYRALSYMWGPNEHLIAINVQGCAFQIRPNLFAFLEIYKMRHPSEYIWIDQLCINQNDSVERSSQVQLMSEIYSGAQEVLVWLNPSHYHQETFEDWSIKLCRLGDACSTCKPIFGFGYNDYWGRMWIMQEVLMANKLTVYYGFEILDWHHVCQLVWAESRRHDWFSSWIHSTFGWMLKTHHNTEFQEHRQIAFSDLVFSSQRNQCTEARDRLYSLQGLVSDSCRLRVDYGQPVLEVLLDGAVMMLHECKDDNAPRFCANIRHLGEVMLSKELDVDRLYNLKNLYFKEKMVEPKDEALSKFRSRLREHVLQYQAPVRRIPSWPKKSYFMSG